MNIVLKCECVRLPDDNLGESLDFATTNCAAKPAAATSTVPSATLGTVPSNDTVVSNDTVLCGDEMALDMSSQSVEIITSEESNLLDLDLRVTLPPSEVTTHDLDVDSEGQFMTAMFYIGESPSQESSDTTAKVSDECFSS